MKFISFKDKNAFVNFISMDVVCEVAIAGCLVTLRLKSGLECTYSGCDKDDVQALMKHLNANCCEIRFE